MTNKLSSCFYWFRAGQFISSLGSMAGYIALSWWIIEKTGSPTALGAILAVPIFIDTLLNPLLAPVVDKYNRKRLSVIGDFWSGTMWLVIALYAQSGHFSTAVVASLYVANVFGSSLSKVAGSVLPRMLVPKEAYEMAMRQTIIIGNVSAILGGLVGGVTAQFLGSVFAFALNGGTFFVAVLCTLFIKQDTTPTHQKTTAQSLSFVRQWASSLKEGFELSLRNKLLLKVVFLSAGIQFFESMFTLSLPILVKTGHGLPESYYGLLKTSAAAGVILATLLFKSINNRLGYVGATLMGCVMFVTAILFIPFTSVLVLPFLMMFVYGFGDVLTSLPLGTRLGTHIPVQFQARVFSILGFLSGIAASLGAYAFGIFVEKFGIISVMVGSGIACGLLLTALFAEGSLIKLLRGQTIIEAEMA